MVERLSPLHHALYTPPMARHAQGLRAGRFETRDRILGVARELFARHGYGGTTIRMIAERAGLTDPAVYYYFPTKRDLYDELLVELPIATRLSATSDLGQAIDVLVQLFLRFAADSDIIRITFREQIDGAPAAIQFRRTTEATYRSVVGPFFCRYYGEAAGQMEDIVTFMLSGLFWDAILRYGHNFETVVREASFQERMREMLQAVLPEIDRQPL